MCLQTTLTRTPPNPVRLTSYTAIIPCSFLQLRLQRGTTGQPGNVLMHFAMPAEIHVVIAPALLTYMYRCSLTHHRCRIRCRGCIQCGLMRWVRICNGSCGRNPFGAVCGDPPPAALTLSATGPTAPSAAKMLP